MPSTIDCKETGKGETYLRNKALEDIKYTEKESWRKNWSSFKSHRFSIFKHQYDKDSAVLNSSLLKQTDSRGLMFSDVRGLIMTHLVITGCRQVRISNSSCTSSVLFVNCSNIYIKCVSFENNSETAVYFINMDGYP